LLHAAATSSSIGGNIVGAIAHRLAGLKNPTIVHLHRVGPTVVHTDTCQVFDVD
jgi:hypothetical protein